MSYRIGGGCLLYPVTEMPTRKYGALPPPTGVTLLAQCPARDSANPSRGIGILGYGLSAIGANIDTLHVYYGDVVTRTVSEISDYEYLEDLPADSSNLSMAVVDDMVMVAYTGIIPLTASSLPGVDGIMLRYSQLPELMETPYPVIENRSVVKQRGYVGIAGNSPLLVDDGVTVNLVYQRPSRPGVVQIMKHLVRPSIRYYVQESNYESAQY